MILTDEEITELTGLTKSMIKTDCTIDVSSQDLLADYRLIESAVLEKLKQQEPIGYWFSDDPAVCTYPGSGYFPGAVPPTDAVNVVPLYAAPMSADDVVKQRDELLVAAEAVEIDAEECMDFDDCTGMFIPIDSYHKLMEAISRVKGGES